MKYVRFIFLLVSMIVAAAVCAAPPVRINYQARLTDASGTPLQGEHSMYFTIYLGGDADTITGLQVYTESATVTARDGIVNHAVGSGTPLLLGLSPQMFDYDGDIYLGVAVDVAENNITPRIRLESVPFAVQAINSQQLNGQPATAYAGADELSKYIPYRGDAYIVAKTTNDAAANGASLLESYEVAKLLHPNGSDLSTTNRAALIVPPARYDLSTGSLTLDAEFVDIIGLSTARDNQYLFGEANGNSSGVLQQAANDIHIENLVVDCTASTGSRSLGSYGPAAYYPEGDTSKTIVHNCEFKANDLYAWSTRLFASYAGVYDHCTAGDYSFGYISDVSGTFTLCLGGDFSFGGSGSGVFGTFEDCKGGNNSFGSANSLIAGKFVRCSAGSFSFGGPESTYFGASISYCTAGANSFASTQLGPLTTILYCVRDGVAYP
jgi:hypothetical protein